jgi:cytochrome c553
MKRSTILAAAPALLAAVPLGLALAVTPSAPALGQAAGHPALPPVAAGTCQACHGPSGISTAPTIPNLAGQKAGYLEAQLKAFKAKTRTNPFMNPIAGQLGDDDIHQLALYWASLPATPATAAAVTPVPSLARLPANFPAGFTLYRDIPADGGGRTRNYANTVSVRAAKAGQPLPEGAIIVTVDYGKDGAVAAYETMEARAGWNATLPPLLRNGDFQYGRFDKAGQPVANFNQAACLACHKGKEAESFMFTRQALVDAKDG